jgi:hypothetical protein
MSGDFAADVDNWVRLATERLRQAHLAIAADVEARVKELTPVDTGLLRASWATVTKVDAMPKDGKDELEGFELGAPLYIVNPVEYARRIEYGFVGVDDLGRRYNQPGVGMVAQAMAELPEIAERALARIAAGGKP